MRFRLVGELQLHAVAVQLHRLVGHTNIANEKAEVFSHVHIEKFGIHNSRGHRFARIGFPMHDDLTIPLAAQFFVFTPEGNLFRGQTVFAALHHGTVAA